jgi:hypothetical protein
MIFTLALIGVCAIIALVVIYSPWENERKRDPSRRDY